MINVNEQVKKRIYGKLLVFIVDKMQLLSKIILEEFSQAQKVLTDFIEDKNTLEKLVLVSQLISTAIKKGGKVISCGNGGSHCDAMHFAEELTGRYRENRKALPAIAISDVSHLSCVSNDFGFEFVFSRFIEALGNNGDVLFAISTSGNSLNVLKAAEIALEKGMKVISLTGNSGGKLAEMSTIEIRVPFHGYADRIQEMHIKIIHILILLIEKLVS